MKIYHIFLFIALFSITKAQIIIDEQMISLGVTHKKITNTVDTLSINILKIDLSNGDYNIKSVKANNMLYSKQTTSEMSKALSDSGFNVIAALNADFFEANGEIINNMISNGAFVKAVKFTDSPFNAFVNSQFAVTNNNNLLLEQFVFSGSIIFPDGTIENVDRINSKADSNSIVLYNSYHGKATFLAPENWKVKETSLVPIYESLDTSFFLVANDFQSGGNLQIPENGFILSANSRYAEYLERNLSADDTVKIILRLNPYYPNIRSLTGGWPVIVKDGKNVIQSIPDIEGVIPRFSENRHPRTGIGFSEDSTIVFFITVDGRQSHSRGMSLLEFADLMIIEGIYQGLNLDGGGSTTMIVKNKIVNSPSDPTGEREVGNCLVLVKRDNE